MAGMHTTFMLTRIWPDEGLTGLTTDVPRQCSMWAATRLHYRMWRFWREMDWKLFRLDWIMNKRGR